MRAAGQPTPRVAQSVAMKNDLVAGVVIVAAATILFLFGGLSPLWGAGANRIASFWPLVMLGVFAALGLTLGVQSTRGRRAAALPANTDEMADSAVSGQSRSRNTLAILAYVPLLLMFGFYVSALAYTFVLPRLLGGVRWRSAALFAVIFTAVLYGLFTLALGMDLPRGYLWLAWRRSAIEAG